MMPPNEKRGLGQNFYFWWLVVVIAMAGILGNYWAELGAGLTLLALVWITIKAKKKWFYSQEKLCDVLFTNTDKAGNKVIERNMQIPVSEEYQTIHMYLQSMNPKKIKNLNVRFGIKKTFLRKCVDILVNRRRMKRLRAYPSPNSWADFRMPTVANDSLSPQINRVAGIYLPNNTPTMSGVGDGGGYISFSPAIRIPVGIPFSKDPAIQIDLEIIALNKWHGFIQCESSIDGVRQFITRKVEVSHKYKVKK